MSSPVVVQGTVVNAPPMSGTQVEAGNHEHQPKKTGCNDPIFAFLFYGNLAAIFAVAAIYGPSAFDTTTSNSDFDYTG
jgi:hypothetical protein